MKTYASLPTSCLLSVALLLAQPADHPKSGTWHTIEAGSLEEVLLLQLDQKVTILRGAPHPKDKSTSMATSSGSSFSTPHRPVDLLQQARSGPVMKLIPFPEPSRYDAGVLRHQPWSIILFAFTLHLGLVCAVAYLYRRHQSPGKEEKERLQLSADGAARGFEYGLCDSKNCLEADFMLCACSFCCMGIRWADTLSLEKFGLVFFWSAVIFWVLCSFLYEDLGLGYYWLLFVGAAVYYRHQLRKSFGLEAGTFMIIAEDCFTWLCCCCCATAQEARQVEYVRPIKKNEQ